MQNESQSLLLGLQNSAHSALLNFVLFWGWALTQSLPHTCPYHWATPPTSLLNPRTSVPTILHHSHQPPSQCSSNMSGIPPYGLDICYFSLLGPLLPPHICMAPSFLGLGSSVASYLRPSPTADLLIHPMHKHEDENDSQSLSLFQILSLGSWNLVHAARNWTLTSLDLGSLYPWWNNSVKTPGPCRNVSRIYCKVD